jgi:uncharacterized membrane protein
MRDGLLVLHILSAAAWIGGGLYSWYAFTHLARAGSEAGDSVPVLARTADRYFGPAAGLTLLTGIVLVLTVDPWGWTDTFVLVGLGAFLFSAIWQPLVSNKVQARLLGAVSGEGDTDRALGGLHRSTAVELAILVFAVWAMVSKLGY